MRTVHSASLPLAVAVTILVLGAGPTAAGPITPDGDLTEWGVTPGSDWTPSSGLAYALDDDTTHSGWRSGGEWYDIEALYLSLNVSGGAQYVNWAMITSYAGVEVPQYSGGQGPNAAGDPVALRNDTAGELDYPYRRHPVLALSFNGSSVWQYGIIMAPGHDWQYDGSGGIDWTASGGLQDYHEAGETADYFWPGNPDYANHIAAIDPNDPTTADTPELWAVSTWRDAHPREFGGGTYHPSHDHPVDFNVDTDDPANTNQLLSGSGSVYAGRLSGYREDSSSDQTADGGGWRQADNWVWEGYVQFPSSEVDFSLPSTMRFHYAMWCGNNDTFGDSISYGEPDDEVPELGTWALLACAGALGGWLKRRSK